MIAARWGLLFVATVSVLVALGATAPDMQPSALRLTVTAAVGVLAPLFWPGIGPAPARTALRIVAWSAAAACGAAVLLRILGGPVQPLPRILGACVMLMLMLLLVHALVAGLEAHLRRRYGDAPQARELAGRTVAIAAALLGALPLWLGPLGDRAARRHAWAVDAAIGLSPLTHLAVASGNDLLRNQWFYQHSNLAGLQFAYPEATGVVWCYASVLLVLALAAPARLRRRRRGASATPAHLNLEKTR
jgi:hypothetical protein